MHKKKFDYEKIFPYRANFNYGLLKIDNETLKYITPHRWSKKIAGIIATNIVRYDKLLCDVSIVDATACIGGDTLTFCSMFGYVFPIEENVERFDDLCTNLKLYDCKSAYPMHGNSMEIIPKIQRKIDVIYIDPPWGGSSYRNHETLELTFDNKELHVVIHELFDLKKDTKIIALKLPINYDFDKLTEKIGKKYNVKIYRDIARICIVIVEITALMIYHNNNTNANTLMGRCASSDNDNDTDEEYCSDDMVIDNVADNGVADNGVANNGVANNDVVDNGVANNDVVDNSTTSVTNNGTARVTNNGTASVTNNGTTNVTNNGITNITNDGITNITNDGITNITNDGIANITNDCITNNK